MDAQHGSPFTSGVTSGSLGQSAAGGMPSPGSAASNWPGSPSGGLAPRPSPRLTGLNSPQPQLMQVRKYILSRFPFLLHKHVVVKLLTY